jgi:hypothetical protein
MGLGSGIRKKPIPDPGSRGQKSTGSRIRNTENLSITLTWIWIRAGSVFSKDLDPDPDLIRTVFSKDLDPDPDLDSANRLDTYPDTDGLDSKQFFPLIQRPEDN